MRSIKAVINHVEDLPEDAIVTGKFVETRFDRQDGQNVDFTIFEFRKERLGDVLKRVKEKRKFNDKLIIKSIDLPE